MRVWIVGFVVSTALTASGVCLWLTWDTNGTPSSTGGTAAPVAAGDVLGVDDGGGGVGTDAGAGALANIREGRSSTTTTAARADDACATEERAVEGDPLADWATVVVDKAHRLPEDFEPPDLVDISEAGFPSTGADRVRRIVVDDLAALRQAAEANGTGVMVVSAYRSYQYQKNLFDQRVAEHGFDTAAATTAQPGHSEHQLGTTIDVLDPASTELTPAFAETPAGRWVAAHAHEYGFVLSYPNEGRDQTCYDFEPWHLRYVGRDVAARIHESGLAPRAWMLQHQESQQ